MTKYTIKDHEISTEKKVEAPGVVEAMLEYLSWQTLQLEIDYRPHHGKANVVDKVTGFMYTVKF